MSRAGWRYLRDSYEEAWETRNRTGDDSIDLLLNALRRRPPPAGIRDPGEPGPVVRDIWARRVEPRHLKRTFYAALPPMLWRAVVAPARAVVDAFRGKRT
jgi:hypothetical protein